MARESGIGETKLKQVFSSFSYEYDSTKYKGQYVLIDKKDYRNCSLWLTMQYDVNGNIDIINTEIEDIIKSENNNIACGFTYEGIKVLKHLTQQQMVSQSVIYGSLGILGDIQSISIKKSLSMIS
ncbi:hypothetical protein R6U77_12760 [Lysinibacillus louembei]|uniref:Uncharacterized protein n=1 Tax=Lysinibacillus louembei TaxID=1470088 RepID=A0ABZ0RU73_9BACI|nr:hypothetical protein [Lysinibacillus louembei]WPK10751.1 hypothetical protein R6U77_12760 [Lysinibacillus louembei]